VEISGNFPEISGNVPIINIAKGLELEMGQWVMGQMGHHFGWVTWVTASETLTHDDKIIAQ